VSGLIVIGSQWGDEGKGKAVDVFSAKADYVIRYQGGSNAGHTLNINNQKKVLHLIPSGIFHNNTTCIISAGVALDIESLISEIKAIKQSGIFLDNPGKLLISDSSTILLDHHRALDHARENSNGLTIGTTGKGIGPAYEDRASRKALLLADIFTDENTLKMKIEESLTEKNFLIEHFYKKEPISLTKTLSKILSLREELKPYRCQDTSLVIHQALLNNKKILFEGAQGSLLDILHGTYPYVTSSNTLAGAALANSGIGPGFIQKVIGIVKAYTTRVGEGPFPTECSGESAEYLQKSGEEWGATTGRKRRCGWLDLPALKYATRVNGITHLALMKLDVLSHLKEIPICVAYQYENKQLDNYPVHSEVLISSKPIYKTLPGWGKDISHIRKLEHLPNSAQNYIEFIQKELNLPIDIISIGSSREATIWRRDLFS